MSDSWRAVDAYIAGKLLGDDDALAAALANNEANGLPPIDVSAAQGKMLFLLAQIAGARRILEIGTLGGYSTIWLARALPEDGELVTLEIEEAHARVARANLDRAGVSDRVDIRVGPASDSLAAMTGAAPFDFVFIDADKQGNAHYVAEAIRLGRSGTTIVVDNVVREGGVLDPDSGDPRIDGTRALFDMLNADARIDATAVQTVGVKKWDGFVLARVR
ncbi:MAG: O-methyltransferase [Sphingopyxis granuli]|jgi:predicted O-methyltransferase YrrM|uniref:O-methyltransferase n=1 Tax=unclassified Sphingopyxis TaxID=2614943 RepID=UPI00086B14D7|nr:MULTISPECIES: O-methyltransferase [unclassified Sphingopyxis]AVA13812.1 methyltransferase [Sphingopyxis sp. MG]ODU29186.1 MAG: methyltransferase [Sphingopyxis sp. SCN 67-31]